MEETKKKKLNETQLPLGAVHAEAKGATVKQTCASDALPFPSNRNAELFASDPSSNVNQKTIPTSSNRNANLEALSHSKVASQIPSNTYAQQKATVATFNENLDPAKRNRIIADNTKEENYVKVAKAKAYADTIAEQNREKTRKSKSE